MSKILIVCNPQNDFIEPGGVLAIDRAYDHIEAINNLINGPFDHVFITQEWIPDDHIMFDGEPFTTKNIVQQTNHEVPIIIWPPHCIQNTYGANIHPNIDLTNVTAILRTSYIKDKVWFSLFEEAYDERELNFNVRTARTHYFDMMIAYDPDEITVAGFTMEHHVLQTAIAAASGSGDDSLCNNVSINKAASVLIDESNFSLVEEKCKGQNISTSGGGSRVETYNYRQITIK